MWQALRWKPLKVAALQEVPHRTISVRSVQIRRRSGSIMSLCVFHVRNLEFGKYLSPVVQVQLQIQITRRCSVEIGKYLSPVVRAVTWQQLVQRMSSKISFSQSTSSSFRLRIVYSRLDF